MESVPANDIVDVEEHGKAGKAPPQAKQYRIRIDKQVFVVDTPTITGLQLLTLVNKQPPQRYQIFEKLHGGRMREIGLNETVDLRTPGIERFVTLPLDQTEG